MPAVMAASFRSHFRHALRPDETDLDDVRMPPRQKPAQTTNTDNRSSKAVQHVSKLARRASRAIGSTEKSEQSTKLVARTLNPTSATSSSSAASRKPPVIIRHSEVLHDVDASVRNRPNDFLPPPTLRTPSLISGSSASTFDSSRSKGIWNTPSDAFDKETGQKRSNTAPMIMERETMHSRNEGFEEAVENSVLGNYLPPTDSMFTRRRMSPAQHTANRKENGTRDVIPPLVSYAPSVTPSTRFTDSPFSHVQTMSSVSSYDPVAVTAREPTAPPPPQSPTRSRALVPRRPGEKQDSYRLGLPSVRESSTSSSNSTVKASQSMSAIAMKDVPRKPLPISSSRKTAGATGPVPHHNPTRSTLSGKSGSNIAPRTLVHIPPELAHLNVDPPSQVAHDKVLPPTRPSRSGIPNLAYATPSPIIQSDLPRLYTTYHKRTPSQETADSASSVGLMSRFGGSSRPTSKNSSPRVDSAISPPPSRNFVRNPTPEVPPEVLPPKVLPPETRKLRRRDSPVIGSAPSPSKSPRFGLFSRKSKADVANPAEKLQRQPTKGPAAGTGHEGYGRFGFRGRSGSTAGSTMSSAGFRSPSTGSDASSVSRPPTQRKGSSTSSKGGFELDDFVKERLNPVILRGSGSTVVSTTSSAEAYGGSTVASSSSSIPSDSFPTPQLLPSAMIGTIGRSPTKHPIVGARKASDSSDDDVATRHFNMASLRSRSQFSRAAEEEPPTNVKAMLPPKTSSTDSYDRSDPAWPRDGPIAERISQQFDPRESDGLHSRHIVTQPKPLRKWNFFQRAQASPRPKGKMNVADAENVSKTNRSVAHYAMEDPVEPVDLHEVERIMRETETSPEDSMSESKPHPKMVPYEHRHASLLQFPSKLESVRDRPTPPKMTIQTASSTPHETSQTRAVVSQRAAPVARIEKSHSEFNLQPPRATSQAPKTQQVTPEMTQLQFDAMNTGSSPKPPRLSPVGRIPHVVSRRDRERKLPDNSFSRPFARTQPHPNVKPPGALYSSIRELASPIEGGSQPASSTSARSETASTGRKSSLNTEPPTVSTAGTAINNPSVADFITFGPRKNSDVSYSSSSGTVNWVVTTGPVQAHADDHWHEYNDLVDDMMPLRTPLSACSSLGVPFQYANFLNGSNSPSIPTPLNWTRPPTSELPIPPLRANTAPAILSVPQQTALPMRPLRLNSTTLSDIVEQYWNRSPSTLPNPSRASMPPPARSSVSQPERSSVQIARASSTSSRYSRSSGYSRSESVPEVNARDSQASSTPASRFRRDTQLLDIAEYDENEETAKSNLGFGALMTSKWLSFGRVLFSPAHNKMRLADEPRVLVLDGLGSDWSYYVALTYPGATVYNLGATSTKGPTSWPGINQRAPSNHRHISHSSIQAAFPFPKGFFTAVVFRFPVAATDAAYQACMCECKRVLRPGGYLEIAVLDLDLVNMGNKARKQVRGLKTRMQLRHPNIDLRNLSDTLVRLIGRRGFEDVQRCVVGIPAAGRIPSSRDISSISSGDSDERHLSQRQDFGQSHSAFSVADLLEDSNASLMERSKTNDEGITKMASKVGRWWYSTCYESSLPDRSIWQDHALLRECEEQGTTFRLLICHAQKPTQTRRRTVSV